MTNSGKKERGTFAKGSMGKLVLPRKWQRRSAASDSLGQLILQHISVIGEIQ